MATVLDRLKVILDMDGVGFQRGINQSKAAIADLGKSVSTGLKSQIGQAFSVVAITAFARSIMDTASNIKDLSDRLELSTDTVQKLELAGKMVGVGMGNLEQGITKMFEGLQSGSKESLSALRTLGVSVEDLQGKSNQQAFDIISAGLAGITNSASQMEAAFGLFGTRGGLKFLQVMREMQTMKTPPMFSGQMLKDIDNLGDNLTKAGRIAGVSASWIAQRAMDVGAAPMAALRSMATGEKFKDIWGAYRGNQPTVDILSDRTKSQLGMGGLSIAAEAEEKAKAERRERWMAIQDEINKTEWDAARQFESNRADQLSAEERRNELLEERLKLLRQLETFSADPETDRLRQAQARLGIANIDRDLLGIRADAVQSERAMTSPNALAAIGGRASVSSGGNNPVTAELKKIHDALTQRGIVLRRN